MPGIRDLKGKVAVVTGAGSGIGRATALALAAKGAKVMLADLRGDSATAVVGEIAELGGEGQLIPDDAVKIAHVFSFE